MNTESEHIDYLITRYIAKEASQEEIAELWRWMDTSTSNKKYFDDILFVHDKAVAAHRIVKVDTDKAWSNISRQMNNNNETKKILIPDSKSIVIPSWMRIAAMLIIISGLGILIFINISKKATPNIIASNQASYEYKLPDSTYVILNKNSLITYDHSFNKRQRKVHLSGEAYFNVVHVPEKEFIVETEGLKIQDIGTSFKVKAYAQDSIVEVMVESGIVKFFSKGNEGIMISKGESGIYRKDNHTFRKSKSDEHNILSFHTHVFLFEDAVLSEVLKKLSSQFNIKISVSNPELLNCHLTVTFEDEKIQNMMSIIAETLGLKLLKDEQGFVLEGSGCNSH